MKAIEEKKALKAEIATIKSDIQEIKHLLQALVPNQSGFGQSIAQPYVGGAPGYIAGPYIGGAAPLTVGQTFTCNTAAQPFVGAGMTSNGIAGNVGGPGCAGVSTNWNVK